MRLRGCFNFCDLGGYETDCGSRTRYQRLFRSEELHLLTAADPVLWDVPIEKIQA